MCSTRGAPSRGNSTSIIIATGCEPDASLPAGAAHIPSVNSRESTQDKLREVETILHALGEWEGTDGKTGFQLVRARGGRLLRIADVVSLHAPGGAATRHLIDAAALQSMKPDAVLVNTGRGTLVDEAALAAALKAGPIAAAGLDVYEREPVVEAALADLPNAVLLPHLGSATLETREAMGMKVADNLDAFFAGREPFDRVA